MGDNNLQGSIQKAAHGINNKPTFKLGDQKLLRVLKSLSRNLEIFWKYLLPTSPMRLRYQSPHQPNGKQSKFPNCHPHS
jgi:hypothetical protein